MCIYRYLVLVLPDFCALTVFDIFVPYYVVSLSLKDETLGLFNGAVAHDSWRPER